MGFLAIARGENVLASSHLAFAHARLPALWPHARGASLVSLSFTPLNSRSCFWFSKRMTGSLCTARWWRRWGGASPASGSVASITERKIFLQHLALASDDGRLCPLRAEAGPARYLLVVSAWRSVDVQADPCDAARVPLLLDVWPLRRFGLLVGNLRPPRPRRRHPIIPVRPARRLLLEKLPLFWRWRAWQAGSPSRPHVGSNITQPGTRKLPVSLRIENAFVSYVRYLKKFFAR